MRERVQHEPQASRFTLEVGGQVAVLDYRLGEGRMSITHTGVPVALRGQGVAADLSHAALGYVRAQGLKVVPACSYAAGFIQRHPEYATLVASSTDQ